MRPDLFCFGLVLDHRIILVKLQTDAVDTMPLVGRRGVPFSLEDMTEVATTIAADDLCPGHAEGAVRVSSHGAGDAVEISRPSAS
jgi:hypothetical protein